MIEPRRLASARCADRHVPAKDTSFREGGRWFRYVPRSQVLSYVSGGWSEVPSTHPLDWSLLMHWEGTGTPPDPFP